MGAKSMSGWVRRPTQITANLTNFTLESRDAKDGHAKCVATSTISEGLFVHVVGVWRQHRDYGWQFKVHRIRPIVPSRTEDIREYLSTGVVPSVGPELAKSLTTRFGDKTLHVMANDPVALTVVPGIGPERASKLSAHVRTLNAYTERYGAMMALGISEAVTVELDKALGDFALMRIQRNPYEILGAFPFFDYDLACEVAHQCHVVNEQARQQSAVVCALNALEVSHKTSVFPTDEMVAEISRLAKTPTADAHSYLQVAADGGVAWISEDGYQVSVPVYVQEAQRIAEALYERDHSLSSLARAVHNLDRSDAVNFKLAMLSALLHPVSVEHSLLVIDADNDDQSVAFALELGSLMLDRFDGIPGMITSVTSVGAQRLADGFGRDVFTLHKLLNSPENRGALERVDWLVVSAAEYLNQTLFARLLAALPACATVFLMGDPYSSSLTSYKNALPALSRYAQQRSAYLRLSARDGASPEPLPVLARQLLSGTASFLPATVDNATITELVSLSASQPVTAWWTQNDRHTSHALVKVVEAAVRHYSANSVLVLSPESTGFLGYPALNERLAPMFNPQRSQEGVASHAIAKQNIWVGDRLTVVQSIRCPKWRPGDTGVIRSFDVHADCFSVQTSGGSMVTLQTSALNRLRLAYAMPVGRMAFSPCDTAIVVMSSRQKADTIGYLYQAMRMVRKRIILVGPRSLWDAMLEELQAARPQERQTILDLMLFRSEEDRP